MRPFFDLTIRDLENSISVLGKEKFRARQLFKWIYGKGIFEFEMMTDLPKSLRRLFSEMFSFDFLEQKKILRSVDGSTKFAFETFDGHTVESVLMPDEDRTTLCISTQIGCKMGCKFCVTGKMGFVRDLKTWEIVSQLMTVIRIERKRITNVVFMGMGEPLDNFDNVKRSIEIFRNPFGLNLSKRRVTLSTVGLIDRLREVPDGMCVIAISLNAPSNEKRSILMPINRIYPIEAILGFAKTYNPDRRTRITFEYVLIKDINDSDSDARMLTELLRGIKCKINIIPYNESPFIDFRSPEEEDVLRFQRILLRSGFLATVRRSRGRDISAACGQLGSTYLQLI